jgi:hypothetical protein
MATTTNRGLVRRAGGRGPERATPRQPNAAVSGRSSKLGLIAIVCGLLLLGGLGAAGYHAWTLRLAEQAQLELDHSNTRRAELRYGDLRVPSEEDRKICNSLTFDNRTGDYVDERRVVCHDLPPPPPPSVPVWNSQAATAPVGPADRMKAMSDAFKR